MNQIPPYITRRDTGRNNSQEGMNSFHFKIPKKSETDAEGSAEAAKASAEEETIVDPMG